MIDRRYFRLTAHLHKGDRVTVTRPGKAPVSGVIKLIWLGMEETVDVRCDDGTEVAAYPGCGDVVTVEDGESSELQGDLG